MHQLENDKLKIVIKETGAELCEISSIKNKKHFLWDANPEIWGSFAPNLFPIVGALKNNCYTFNNKTYYLPKHGFLRHNTAVRLHEKTSNSITFKLAYNDELLKIYPFKFEFYISYTLINNRIEINHTVKNRDTKTMYFSLGGHPAFKCPINKGELYSDYFLEFEHIENCHTQQINKQTGLITAQTKPFLNAENKIKLTDSLFNNDALIFKTLKSKSVALKSVKQGSILTVRYSNFNYLGIWAKPKANYVCIEPWLGIADHENTNQDLKTKEGIIPLSKDHSFNASYSIEIHENQLKDVK